MHAGRTDPGHDRAIPRWGLRSVFFAALFSLLLSTAAIAAEPDAQHGVKWQELNDSQREVLARFEDRWDQLPLARQEALARGAERWATMSPEEKQLAKECIRRWREMHPDERSK